MKQLRTILCAVQHIAVNTIEGFLSGHGWVRR